MPFVAFRGPQCGCRRPVYLDGKCDRCYRSQTPLERKLNHEFPDEPLDIEAEAARMIADLETLLKGEPQK